MTLLPNPNSITPTIVAADTFEQGVALVKRSNPVISDTGGAAPV